MHALIIEDEPIIAMSIEEILRTCGFTSFDLATTVEDAVSAAERNCPDLITADVDLKPGSGIDAVNVICSGPPIPVIFITGSPTEAKRKVPQYRMIEKPFTASAVVAAVESALNDQRSENNARITSNRIDASLGEIGRIQRLS